MEAEMIGKSINLFNSNNYVIIDVMAQYRKIEDLVMIEKMVVETRMVVEEEEGVIEEVEEEIDDKEKEREVEEVIRLIDYQKIQQEHKNNSMKNSQIFRKRME